MRTPIPLLAVALAGCATSSGVHQTGAGIYTVSSTAFTSMGGSATAKGDALKKATATCAAQGKQLEVIDQDTDSNISGGSADVTFRCIAA